MPICSAKKLNFGLWIRLDAVFDSFDDGCFMNLLAIKK